VIADKRGNLYGTTGLRRRRICGIVYELSHVQERAVEGKILYSFTGGSDGQYPSGSLALDATGNLYGATSNGGQNGYGAVFEINALREG